MPRGRRDTSDSLDSTTPRGHKSDVTEESTFGGSSDPSQARPPGLDLKSHANRFKKKLQSFETNDDNDTVNASSLRPLGLKPYRYRRKLNASACTPDSGIPIDSTLEFERAEVRSRSAMYFGSVLEEKKREFQNVVTDFKSKLQTPRRFSSAPGEASLPESNEEIDSAQASNFRPALQKVSRCGRKSSNYIAGPSDIAADDCMTAVATETGPLEKVPEDELNEAQLDVTAPQKSVGGDDKTDNSDVRAADACWNESTEQPLLLKFPRYGKRQNTWNEGDEGPANYVAENTEDVPPTKKGPISPRILLFRKSNNTTSETGLTGDWLDNTEDPTPKFGISIGVANRTVLEEKKKEFQNVIVELKTKIQSPRRSAGGSEGKNLWSTPLLQESNASHQDISGKESNTADRAWLGTINSDEGGILKPLRIGKARRRGGDAAVCEKLPVRRSSPELSLHQRSIDDMSSNLDEAFDLTAGHFGKVKRMLKRRNPGEGPNILTPISAEDLKADKDAEESENEKLTREICQLQDRLVELETEVQTLQEKLNISEERLVTESSRVDLLFASLDRAQELRYQNLMTVFNENYKMLGALESQFELVLSENYNTRRSTTGGRIGKLAWLVIDTICLVLVMIVGFITRSRSYFRRRQAIANCAQR